MDWQRVATVAGIVLGAVLSIMITVVITTVTHNERRISDLLSSDATLAQKAKHLDERLSRLEAAQDQTRLKAPGEQHAE